MSSNLKDARWQLAHDMAEDDGLSILDFPGPVTARYLRTAQERLEGQPHEFIDRLAARWRSES